MAIVRLLLPDINIPATTAMETLNKQGRVIALQCGANVVMPNVTEGEYRKLYALYPGKKYVQAIHLLIVEDVFLEKLEV